MRAVLPGKPQDRLQAVCTGFWEGRQLVAYISGNAFVILDSSDAILQTIYNDDEGELEAIAFDDRTGKIATCAGNTVHIYRPYGQDEGDVRWSLQAPLTLESPGNTTSTLSWGGEEELLVGNTSLTLYATHETPEAIWARKLANPAKLAHISYDSSYIASTGSHDKLVKVWRRLSFGSDEVRFDFTYLLHTQAVTELRWRRPYHLDQTIDNVLYTICADNMLRIWAATDPHGLQILQLWAEIDLQEAIQARNGSVSGLRYAFLIDGKDFSRATEHAVQMSHSEMRTNEDHALEHLVEVANRSPEVCVVLDDQGRMSAWGLESVGCKARKTTNIFNIAHVSDLPREIVPMSHEGYIRIYNYCAPSSGNLKLLMHHFDGSIRVFESNISHLFDLSTRNDRVKSLATWTGQSGPIKKIVRSISGTAIVSRTDDSESIVWKYVDSKTGATLSRQSVIKTSEHIHRICVIRKGHFVVYLHHSSLSLWDCRLATGRLLASRSFQIRGKPLCILVLPEAEKDSDVAHIAVVSSQMEGIVWQLRLPHLTRPSFTADARSSEVIEEFCVFDLGAADNLAYILPVDPAGSAPVVSGFLDSFARDMALSYTHDGLLRAWTAKVDVGQKSVEWLQTCAIDTGIVAPSLASGSSIRKAALVNATRSELTIWDMKGAQLEFTQDYASQDVIQDLDWNSTPDDQSILAVGFNYRVILLAQMRFDYLNEGPAWAAIQEFNVRDMTPHPIGDSTWLSNGSLVIGAGNQLFVYDKTLKSHPVLMENLRAPERRTEERGSSWDLLDVVTRLNGPLPLFHPQFLGQCILSGKMTLAQKILLTLHKVLRYHVDGEQIDNMLGMSVEDFYTEAEDMLSGLRSKEMGSAFTDFEDDDNSDTMSEELAASMVEILQKKAIPQLSSQEQVQLTDIIGCVALVEKQRRSMDENAARFTLFFRQHALQKKTETNKGLSWREINWAYHSDSQDILTDIVGRQFSGRMLWKDARDSGMFMWITDHAALLAQFEVIARNEYTKSDLKDPISCSIYYLALKKKTVLAGLWRMASWNREQSATLRLLQNNFSDAKWRTVALKNAYALLGKRRFEYAAAFFLLADHLHDAVNVCLNQLQDLQLAITITRIYASDDSPILHKLLEERILPLAATTGDRWLASWAFWMLNRRDMAVRALISPVYTLLPMVNGNDLSKGIEINNDAKGFLTEDPALVVLYRQLRGKTLQTLRGAREITPQQEWDFLIRNARLYDRMGCDILALDLVRNWEFLLTPPIALKDASLGNKGEVVDARKLLRRRSSLVVDDMALVGLYADEHGHERKSSSGEGDGKVIKKQPPTVFEEPESNSLLDSFGF